MRKAEDRDLRILEGVVYLASQTSYSLQYPASLLPNPHCLAGCKITNVKGRPSSDVSRGWVDHIKWTMGFGLCKVSLVRRIACFRAETSPRHEVCSPRHEADERFSAATYPAINITSLTMRESIRSVTMVINLCKLAENCVTAYASQLPVLNDFH